MPHQRSPKVTECLTAAAEVRRLYELETDPDAKLRYLQLEQCWFRLADHYAFIEQLRGFIKSLPH
jgi:hypothetical protein